MLGLLGLLLLGPLSQIAFGDLTEWRSATRASSGQAPDPVLHAADAIVQVYGARTLGWRGAFGIHSWIATKRSGATEYTVHHVIGWRYYRGGSPVVSQRGVPDFHWFGARPTLIAEKRGPDVDRVIDDIEAAVASYPHADLYRVWPGPNSNTFTAWIAREVPALRVDLPANALGKDYLGGWRIWGPTPSGTGRQLSLFGVAGVAVGWHEGIEINLLGLSAGVDFDDLRLRVPGLGFLEPFARSPVGPESE